MRDALDFFQKQTVFLTGATGGLGICLLYKLTLVLKVPKIFVLVRVPPGKAVCRWREHMPDHADELVSSGRIRFVNGDMTRPGFGVDNALLQQMEGEVTTVINAAANISLKASLRRAVQDNCMSSLELARMATRFRGLVSFVQVSSLYAMSFLPDGPVHEEIYPIENARGIVLDILDGCNEDWRGYAWPYARSKHLMECLLAEQFPNLPLLILRPSSIGPAISQPYELYGPIASTPISSFYSRLMYPVGGTSLFHATEGEISGKNILDEIPVDLVANILLQHVQRATRGIVHASSLSYIPKTFDRVAADVKRWVSEDWRHKMTTIIFTADRSAQQCHTAEFYRMTTRNWKFLNDKSRGLNLHGPLGIDFSNHNVELFTERRLKQIFHQTKLLLRNERAIENSKRLGRLKL